MLPSLPDVDRSVTQWPMAAIGSTLILCICGFFVNECATPPHAHPIFRYVTVRDMFYQAFPLQAANAGVRRPMYEAAVLHVLTYVEVWEYRLFP